jgi:thiol:disulfide interchange protein DsbA
MNKLSTGWIAAVTLALTTSMLPVHAQQLGTQYSEITPPVTADSPDKIEVTEFFSYSCPHCNDLNPALKQWAAKQASDVTFRQVAVGFGMPYYQLTAKLFYSLDAIGEEKRLNDAVFAAIHSKGVKLLDEKAVSAWVASQGVDSKKFADAANSFGVLSQIKRSDMLVEKAKIRGVPGLVVDGRYLVGGPGIKSPQDLLAVADKLVDKVRAERALKKK